MEKIFNGVSIIIGIVGGAATALFGQWDKALWALLAVVVFDYVTGVIKAIYKKSLSSEVGYKGILKKVTIFIMVGLANVLQTVTDTTGIREIVIMFFIANEGISVLENAAVIYPKMPDALKNILLQLRGDNKEE